MKNERGFVASSVLYVMLGLFLSLMIGVISIYSNRKILIDRIKEDVVTELEADLKASHLIGENSDYYVAAQVYINAYPDAVSSLNQNNDRTTIEVNKLINAGLLPENIVSPVTKRKELTENNYVGVILETDGSYSYTYVDSASYNDFYAG